MRIKILLSKAEFYYQLSKVSKLTVPQTVLEGDAEPIHYSDEDPFGEVIQGIDINQPIPFEFKPRTSTVPHYKNYFSNTDIPYHIIFIGHDSTFGLRRNDTIAGFKEKLENLVNSSSFELASKQREYAEATYLLNNWQRLFSNAENSITILARDFDIDDRINPIAIDHDINHYLFESDDKSNLFINNLKTNLEKACIDAFQAQNLEDGSIKNLSEIASKAIDTFNKKINIILMMLFSKHRLSESISSANIASSNNIEDLLNDLLPLLRSVKSFKNLKINLDTTLYLQEQFESKASGSSANIVENFYLKKIILSPNPIPEPKHRAKLAKVLNYKIYIKADKIAEIESAFTLFLSQIEDFIYKKLESLKGKVIIFWGN